MARRERLSKDMLGCIDLLIDSGAVSLRAKDIELLGWTTDDLVREIRDAAWEQARPFQRAILDDLIARRVPSRLGGEPQKTATTWQPLLTGLDLPAYFSVPAVGTGGAARWKRDRDISTDELGTVIAHRRTYMSGYQFETQKYVVLRETAIRRGADPAAPISSVMDEDQGGGTRLADAQPWV